MRVWFTPAFLPLASSSIIRPSTNTNEDECKYGPNSTDYYVHGARAPVNKALINNIFCPGYLNGIIVRNHNQPFSYTSRNSYSTYPSTIPPYNRKIV